MLMSSMFETSEMAAAAASTRSFCFCRNSRVTFSTLIAAAKPTRSSLNDTKNVLIFISKHRHGVIAVTEAERITLRVEISLKPSLFRILDSVSPSVPSTSRLRTVAMNAISPKNWPSSIVPNSRPLTVTDALPESIKYIVEPIVSWSKIFSPAANEQSFMPFTHASREAGDIASKKSRVLLTCASANSLELLDSVDGGRLTSATSISASKSMCEPPSEFMLVELRRRSRRLSMPTCTCLAMRAARSAAMASGSGNGCFAASAASHATR
mmetsp:Transcript_18283/g.26795  ORF Transcript_18283/g.26795 Transcript_18283/m.26795 type:complete len:268 (-) Transcript_18283:468-1271(-)